MSRKGIAIWLIGFMIMLNLSPTEADWKSKETHDVNLYIFGEGGDFYNPTTELSGKITTKAPNSTMDESQILHPNYLRSQSEELFRWYFEPLYSNISIIGDVLFTIWANSNETRNICFSLSLCRRNSDGSGQSIGVTTSSKIVHNEPVEFSAVISEEIIAQSDLDLKNFNAGDRIGIGIEARYYIPQPPAEVRVLYNSTNHPSHMTINTDSISIDILNSDISGDKANMEVEITDAFGIYDIVDYDVQIHNLMNINIANPEINETKIPGEGKINLNISCVKSGDKFSNYFITITVTDNNDNHWARTDQLEIDFPDVINGFALSPDILILIGVGILAVILIYIFFSRRKKK